MFHIIFNLDLQETSLYKLVIILIDKSPFIIVSVFIFYAVTNFKHELESETVFVLAWLNNNHSCLALNVSGYIYCLLIFWDIYFNICPKRSINNIYL